MNEYGDTKDRGAVYASRWRGFAIRVADWAALAGFINIRWHGLQIHASGSMKKRFVSLCLLLTFTVGVESCVPHYNIRVVNNSRQAVYVYAGYVRSDSLPVHKPDFLLEVPDKSTRPIYDTDVNDPKFKRLYRDRLTVFVLDKDKVDAYDWITIQEDNMILKRYMFNRQELIEMGREVVYP
jgi:hypothetical protein